MINPLVSPSISIPWYSLWAICIVLEAPKPSLLDADCCNVEVVKGPEGFLEYIFDVISVILYLSFFIFSIAWLISFLFLKLNFSIFLLLIWKIFDVIKFPSFVLKFTFKDQNSSGLKISISCSLSVKSLRATDCTLPAD